MAGHRRTRAFAAPALSFLLAWAGVADAQETTNPDPGAPQAQVPPAPEPKPAQPTAKPVEPSEGKFEFGSYGRVNTASDLRGGYLRGVNVVGHGPRIGDEDSYAELELRREDTFKEGIKSRVVTTLALFPPFFHFTGKVNQQIGVRNLYAQGEYQKLTLWAGSRMYRGDDIYLLNWWPLDNQNTVGGGAGIMLPSLAGDTMIALHMGMQRLDDPYQYQTVQAVNPLGFGSVDTIKVDRPRIIESLKVTHFLRNAPGRTIFRGDDGVGLKFIAYGEAHQMGTGVQRDPVTSQDRALPADNGWLAGAQVGYWTGHNDTFAHIFVRHARGLAAYDPLSVPTTFANDYTTHGASESRLAVAGNVETTYVGMQWGAYLLWFRDASEAAQSAQKYDEGVINVRPHFFLGDHWGIAVDGSYQKRRYALPATNGDGMRSAGLTRFAFMPYFSPSGRGTYKRPQLRLIYSVALRDQGARGLYPAEDVFSQRGTEHLLGISAEWWFNSSSYP